MSWTDYGRSKSIHDWLLTTNTIPDTAENASSCGQKRKRSEATKAQRRDKRQMESQQFDDTSNVQTPRRSAGVGRGDPPERSFFQLPPSPERTTSDPWRSRAGPRSNASYARSESQASASQTTSRSGSPTKSGTKRKRDIQLSVPTITFQDESDWDEISSGDLFASLKDAVIKAQRSIPVVFEPALEEENSRRGVPLKLSYSESEEDNLQHHFFWMMVDWIHEGTKECMRERQNEESWSDFVILKVLECAKRRVGLPNVKLMNVKSIDVAPKSLLPIGPQGSRIGTKRVDYTLGLDLPSREQTNMLLRALSTSDPSQASLNQTDDEVVYRRPLFCDVEIKRQAASGDGEVQIGVWCAAGFKKLRRMFQTRGVASAQGYEALPAMPLWLVEGHEWKLYIATQKQAEEMMINGPVETWSVRTKEGIVRLIMTFTYIMKWGDEVYKPWFLRQVAYGEEMNVDVTQLL